MSRNIKTANVTIEISFMMTMVVVGTMLAITVFGNSLAQMILSSNITNIFKSNSNKSEVTAYYRDYSSSQVNVQVTASQGLEFYETFAADTIASLLARDSSQLSSQDLQALAKALVIAQLTGIKEFEVSGSALTLNDVKKRLFLDDYGKIAMNNKDNFVEIKSQGKKLSFDSGDDRDVNKLEQSESVYNAKFEPIVQ